MGMCAPTNNQVRFELDAKTVRLQQIEHIELRAKCSQVLLGEKNVREIF